MPHLEPLQPDAPQRVGSLGIFRAGAMAARHVESVLSWVAAALIVMAGAALIADVQEEAGAKRRRLPAEGVAKLTPAQEPRDLQYLRAAEPGRGRRALAPWQIPFAGWKDILWRTYAGVGEDRLLAIAAGVVFYSLLALFPAITAGVSIYALFANAGTIAGHISDLALLLPGGALDIVSEQVHRIVERGAEELTLGFVVGLGVAIWSANAGMKAIFDALNVIYDEDEHRGFIKLNLISLLFTTLSIAFVLVMVASAVVAPIAFKYVGLASNAGVIVAYGRWPALFVIGVLALAVLFRFGPSRQFAQWRWLSVGSVFAAAAWIIMSIAFSWYVANFGTYNATYGSLGAAIGMMMWMWLSIIVVLVGAELNSEIEHQTARDSTTGAPLPLGLRGATMADTVGEAQD
jgi:membrane protein